MKLIAIKIKCPGLNIKNPHSRTGGTGSVLLPVPAPFKYFYIRPEDVSVYEPYVDYFEFFGKLDRQAVLYKIYKEGQWLGSLNELIGGLKNEIPNVCIVPYFGTARVGCGKRCSYNKSCEVCSNIKNLAKVLESKDFGITTERKKIDEGMKIKYDK